MLSQVPEAGNKAEAELSTANFRKSQLFKPVQQRTPSPAFAVVRFPHPESHVLKSHVLFSNCFGCHTLVSELYDELNSELDCIRAVRQNGAYNQ